MRVKEFDRVPLLTGDELREMTWQIMLDPELFAAASEADIASYFCSTEVTYRHLLFSAGVLRKDIFDGPLPIESLIAETSASLERESSGSVDECELLQFFGAANLPQWALTRFPGIVNVPQLPGTSFLERLATLQLADFAPEQGRTLLRRFLQERAVGDHVRRLTGCGHEFKNPDDLLAEVAACVELVQSIGRANPRPLSNQWGDHESYLEAFSGRELEGLRTGLAELDRRTGGLRDLTILGAPPGIGKTALALECAVGVVDNFEQNDAIVIFVTLEMSLDTIITRLKCNLSNLAYTTLKFGSPELRHGARSGRQFSPDDLLKLQRMQHRYTERQFGQRLWIIDRSQMDEKNPVRRLVSLVNRAKRESGASRALIVLDYLQVLPIDPAVEDKGELTADRQRVAALKELLDRLHTGPLGDAVLAISEARKPASSKEAWGESVSELMGSARIGYAASAILLMSRQSQLLMPLMARPGRLGNSTPRRA